jgi:hypothetical protein
MTTGRATKQISGVDVRAAFTQAMEEVPGPFNLKGRGCEARCTFDRRLAAYLRGVDLPHVVISGFGANKHYPWRLVNRAAEILNRSLGRDVLKFHQGSAYIDDE